MAPEKLEVDLWQVSQEAVVCMCPEDLPLDLTPSWQLTQLPTIPVCLNVTESQSVDLWQVSQLTVVGICWLGFAVEAARPPDV